MSTMTHEIVPQLGRRLARRSFGTQQQRPVGLLSEAQERKQKKRELIERKEQAAQTRRREEKAERDERMDLSKALSEVKTYRGGFTRPQMLRTSNWWKGGAYVKKGKKYESPPASAYEPHTVFLLESRYPIKGPVDRPDVHEHILGIVKTSKFEAYLEHLQSPEIKRATLDKAHWPFLPAKHGTRTKWWEDPQDKEKTLRELRGLDFDADVPASSVSGPSSSTGRAIGTLLASSPARSPSPTQVRFYSSRAPPDRSEDVVPDYYIERKRQRDAIAERKEQEGDLMYELSAGIIADALTATTQRSQPKIPVEFTDEHGAVHHPSGFAVPTGSGRETDSPVFDRRKATKEYKEQQTAGVRDRVRETIGLRDQDVTDIMRGGVKPREEKIPVEIEHPDGSVAHPSGFVPPMPNTSFTHGVKNGRAFHSSAVSHAMPLDGKVPLIGEPEPPVEAGTSSWPPKEGKESPEERKLRQLRQRYEPTLSTEPFWRPLITLELSTRPLAETMRRLSTAKPRGLSYIASIEPDERKQDTSCSDRLRCMRINRMQELTKSMSELLAGYRGGPVGIRFSPEEKGRGWDGESMEKPIPYDKRQIKVGVGEWYKRAEEVKEGFVQDAEEVEGAAVEVYGLDDFGKPIKS
ncbi:hypothetical protein GLOTRDRAFT_117233 [Gloeophyllum trabeum ATCC 11539]|uniref:Uncharacterized protein n=1 Tax=Gloeophyllum trabeum (strain ATCC 11539 / FP-39264 / Madison 617) TaxID=670483 RepID=S7Q0W6_GLOTA|nr:uncharacterized protein GLOTRDRAFT_117233 [Gloeophyllum trabeum ATCC 11539]EPQ53157.1 hypothetical protein GLOTRDRAFT_117233 [Gloeophyllum trabeum ATCC 11539]